MTTKLSEELPLHLQHLKYTCLYQSLEESIKYFFENKIINKEFISKLIQIFAIEFEKSFDRNSINSKILEISENSQIINYRYNKGFWSIVIPNTTLLVTDHHISAPTGKTIFFKESVNVCIQGSGGALRKGKRKSESIKRAHTRQIAKDARWQQDRDEDDSDEDDSDEWKP